MSIILEPAKQFFEACETGKGWDACKAFCNPDATFSSQTNALSEISTLEGYCEWMKNLFTPIPDGHYELKFFAADEAGQICGSVCDLSMARKQGQAGQYHRRKRRLLQTTFTI